MFNFGEQLPDTVDYARRWGDYYGEIDERAQRRWANRELRRGVDEENRYNLDRARSNQSAYANRAGLFETADQRFAGMNRRDVPNATPTGPGRNAVGGTGPANLTPDAAANEAAPPAPQGLAEQALASRDLSVRTAPVRISELTEAQRAAWSAYAHAVRTNPVAQSVSPMLRASRERPGVTEAQRAEARARLRQAGLDIENGRLVRVRSPNDVDAEGLVWPGPLGATTDPNAPSATATIPPPIEPGVEDTTVDTPDTAPYRGPNTQVNPGGLEPPDAAFYRGDPDTSAALQPTPEMRMLETVVQDQLRLAQVAASHGRNAEAEQFFAQALQSQAAYIHQERLTMLRAASQGHRTALADLLGLYSGRPANTTRLAPTGEDRNRFHIEVLNNEGQWISATSNPLTMGQLFERAEYLVDREAVAARSESNAEIIRASIAAGADIQVAQINALSAEQDRYVRAMIANADNETRERIARGEGRLVVDSTNNRAYYEYQEIGPNGEPVPVIVNLSEQDVRVPDTNGRRTERQVVGRRVTGVAGVTGSGAN